MAVGAPTPPGPGTLFVVATPIGNLEDISARALRVLREVALIAAEDTRHTARLLARYAIGTPTTSLHEHNEAAKSPMLLERLRRGESIAVVSDAGTPTVSDPGQRLIHSALQTGVRVEPVPGPSAAMAAIAASGFPADTFMFLGFPPLKASARTQWMEALRTAGRTVVFFEAPHRIRDTLGEIAAAVGECDVCVGRELTKAHEQLVVGPITDVLRRLTEARGEFTVVVNIGQKPENTMHQRPGGSELAAEFGDMTNTEGMTRRRAVAALARRHRLPANEVYRAIELFKKSGE